jgi:hypothetical protein
MLNHGKFHAIETGLLQPWQQRELFWPEMVGPNECISAELHVIALPFG